MTGAAHRLGGVLAGVILAEHIQADVMDSSILLFGAVFGSLLPDIDNPRSSISGKLPVVSGLVGISQQLVRLLSCLFPGKLRKNIRSMARHRGMIHSLMLPLLLTIPLLFCKSGTGCLLISGGIVGILSHLLLDMLSGGVPLFMPFFMKRIKLAGIRTGGLWEKAVMAGMVAAIVWSVRMLWG